MLMSEALEIKNGFYVKEDLEVLGKKLDENPGDTESRKKLTGILAARGDPQAELHEWMLKNEKRPGCLIVDFNSYKYYWGDVSTKASSPWSLLDKDLHNLLESDFKEGNIHWKYYKTRQGAELALFEALKKLGVLPFVKIENNTLFDGLPIKKLDTSIKIPVGFFGVEGEREKEINRLQAFLDTEPTNWEYRQRLGILLQATNQKASQLQMWMAEKKVSPIKWNGTWFLGDREHPSITRWGDPTWKAAFQSSFLSPEDWNKLSSRGDALGWKKYPTRQEAEEALKEILA